MRGEDVTAIMGLNTWVAFFGTNERAHVAGDVAMTAKEVNYVIRALRLGGIDVVAVHTTCLASNPASFSSTIGGLGPLKSSQQR